MIFTDNNSLEERVELWKQTFVKRVKELRINPIFSWDVCHKNSIPFIYAKLTINNLSIQIISDLDKDNYWIDDINQAVRELALKNLQGFIK